MMNRFRWVVTLTVWALSCGGHSGASEQGAKPVAKGHAMEPSSHNGIRLTATLRSEDGKPLLPEEAPIFEVHLRNDGGAPQSLTSISNSIYSPTVRLFDST